MGAQLFYIGVKGLIQNEHGQYLLLLADVSSHRGNTEPYWDIPGGRIDEGGGLIDTLEREIEEETGITELIGDPEQITTVVSNHRVPVGDDFAGLTLVVYKVAIPEGSTIKLSKEHSDYKWVEAVEAAQRLSNKYPKQFTDVL